MGSHNAIIDIHNWIMDIHHFIIDIHKYCASWISIIELGISIIELWISMTLLWMSIFNYGCPSLNLDNDYVEDLFVFGFPYSTHLPMPRIYCCFIHFVLFWFYYTPPPPPTHTHTHTSTKLQGGVHWFHIARMSVCGQNRVRCVSATMLAASISYLQILPTNFRRCVVCYIL